MANLTSYKKGGENRAARLRVWTPTIAASATASDGIPTHGESVVGITFPGSFTGTSLQAQASLDGLTWFDLNGVVLSITLGEAYNLDPNSISKWPFVRFVSNATEGFSRTLNVITKSVS